MGSGINMNIGDAPAAPALTISAEHIAQKSAPSWVEWVERNSKPLVRKRHQEERKLTKWQKKGPMKQKDWKKFFHWAEKRAMPQERKFKEEEQQQQLFHQASGRAAGSLDVYDQADKLEELARPRIVNKKHQFHDNEPTYSPVIVLGQPPHRDKGRPFQPPYVPCCFQHDDVEANFWSQLRFPIRKEALRTSATPRIISLAKPRTLPVHPHCPIPPRSLDPLDVPPPKRKKFTAQGWRLHQIRLIYLSKPMNRGHYEYFYL
ncbi:uncharacterized protein LOC117586530 [Drosophila guanche]|uniref:Uncharacterized protein n=1 Tax=Drosophila guanche TaxID=7266 RepID=A0A3B0KDF2_DROGU|nr:uncharacterized protein LOC117586530 [Drosophila guanche]SPP83766.1 Hypothetical predicted protein [Drosophila guanche]